MVYIQGVKSESGKSLCSKLKEPMLVLKQMIPQKKALILSFKMTTWKWVWHYHEAATPSCSKRTIFTPHAPMLFTARGHGAP